jgi:hypothetical protein
MGLRTKGGQLQETYPLFDIQRFTRHIEAGFTTISEANRQPE